jgi:hypothetical protein
MAKAAQNWKRIHRLLFLRLPAKELNSIFMGRAFYA